MRKGQGKEDDAKGIIGKSEMKLHVDCLEEYVVLECDLRTVKKSTM